MSAGLYEVLLRRRTRIVLSQIHLQGVVVLTTTCAQVVTRRLRESVGFFEPDAAGVRQPGQSIAAVLDNLNLPLDTVL